MLILATGGYIKQSKSQVGLSIFTFVNGQPKLKKEQDLPTFQFTIPEKSGSAAPIPTVNAMTGTNSLGVKFDMENKCLHQVKTILHKGSKWLSRLNSDIHICRHDGWNSYFRQLTPSLSYSVLTLSAEPKKVEAAQGSTAFCCLSKLGINQHIDIALQTMSNKFGGLELMELNSMGLGERIHHVR